MTTMTSNVFSKFLPPAAGEPSIYDTLRQEEDESDQSDIEERAGMAIDEENLGTRFRDYDLDDALTDATSSHPAPFRTRGRDTGSQQRNSATVQDRSRDPPSRKIVEEMDDEVPQSLLIEDQVTPISKLRKHPEHSTVPPVPGPSTQGTRARWQTTQDQQRLHQEIPMTQDQPRTRQPHINFNNSMAPKERALWMWANVENLDNFLQDVYDYYIGNGIWSIYLYRILNLLYVGLHTVAHVAYIDNI